MRARLAIAASGQRCELREVVLRDKPQELLAASPKGTVPVLVDADGRVLEQSLDIMRWALARNDPQQWLAPEEGSLEDMLALIARFDNNDAGFKFHLDRYKYASRYTTDANASRSNNAEALDSILSLTPTLLPGGEGLFSLLPRGEGPGMRENFKATHDGNAHAHRAAASMYLDALETRLGHSAFLFGARVSLADMAIAPFVRQFAIANAARFEAQPWPRLRAWLAALLDSPLWNGVMQKFPAWRAGEAGAMFP